MTSISKQILSSVCVIFYRLSEAFQFNISLLRLKSLGFTITLNQIFMKFEFNRMSKHGSVYVTIIKVQHKSYLVLSSIVESKKFIYIFAHFAFKNYYQKWKASLLLLRLPSLQAPSFSWHKVVIFSQFGKF